MDANELKNVVDDLSRRMTSEFNRIDSDREFERKLRRTHLRYIGAICLSLATYLGYTNFVAIPNEVADQLPKEVSRVLGTDVKEAAGAVVSNQREAEAAMKRIAKIESDLNAPRPWLPDIAKAIQRFGLGSFAHRPGREGHPWSRVQGGLGRVPIGEPALGSTHDNEVELSRPSQSETEKFLGLAQGQSSSTNGE